jgi:hypothetical protein
VTGSALQRGEGLVSSYCYNFRAARIAAAISNTLLPPLPFGQIPYSLSVTLGQEARIVLKYVRANPEKANMGTSLLATKALEEGFPCRSAQRHNQLTINGRWMLLNVNQNRASSRQAL